MQLFDIEDELPTPEVDCTGSHADQGRKHRNTFTPEQLTLFQDLKTRKPNQRRPK